MSSYSKLLSINAFTFDFSLLAFFLSFSASFYFLILSLKSLALNKKTFTYLVKTIPALASKFFFISATPFSNIKVANYIFLLSKVIISFTILPFRYFCITIAESFYRFLIFFSYLSLFTIKYILHTASRFILL